MTAPALPDAPSPALTGLLELLDLERIEVDIFRGRSPQENRQRVFGGQVAGQALIAAGRTVPEGRRVHSLHAYFLRGGDVAVPIVYEVDRIRDGRSFTTRRVVAVQHGRAIFNLSASFQADEPGVEHTSTAPDVPGPGGLPTFREHTEKLGLHNESWVNRPRPIDMRYVEAAGSVQAGPPRQQVWLRTDGPLPDDPLLHVCALTYASDLTLLDSALLAHGLRWSDAGVMAASLDHAMWFHRPFRADEWLLYDQRSTASAGARGFCEGQIYRSDGTLAVSVAQEGLLRVTR